MGLSPGIVTVLQEGFRPLSAQEHPPLMRSPPPSPTNPSPCQAEAIRLEVRDLLHQKGPFQKSLIQTLGFTPTCLSYQTPLGDGGPFLTSLPSTGSSE